MMANAMALTVAGLRALIAGMADDTRVLVISHDAQCLFVAPSSAEVERVAIIVDGEVWGPPLPNEDADDVTTALVIR